MLLGLLVTTMRPLASRDNEHVKRIPALLLADIDRP